MRKLIFEMLFFLLVSQNLLGKVLTLGLKRYILSEKAVYIVSAQQSAFTKVISPLKNDKALLSYPLTIREMISNIGHLGIVYIDEHNNLRVSEFTWNGAFDRKIEDSLIFYLRDKITAVFKVSGINVKKFIELSRRCAKNKIGWYLSEVDSRLGVIILNFLLSNNYDSYRSCVSHLQVLLSNSGQGFMNNAIYLPIRVLKVKALKKYLESVPIFTRGPMITQLKYQIAADLLYLFLKVINIRNYIKNLFFQKRISTYVTPAQFILGNLIAKKIQIVEPFAN